MRTRVMLWAGAIALLAVGLAGCGAGEAVAPEAAPAAPAAEQADATPTAAPSEGSADPASPTAAPESPTETASEPAAPPPAAAANPPPDWLGTRVLEAGPQGFADAQETPEELRDRRLITAEFLPPPADVRFQAEVQQVPDDVAARSTWSPQCPVALEELRYVTVTFWGFDEAAHTGEVLAHAEAADDLVEVFRRLHEARFPIEEMRITTAAELDAPPTGDGNNTSAFVCRPAVGRTSWSQHAYGLAVDVNPFHNPYVQGAVVLPELATSYADRDWHRPGMIHPGDVVTEAFAAIGWGWGGDWSSAKDWMHFSRSGR